jgi:hypothetical protein
MVALVLGGALVVRNLVATDWDPTIFTAFGVDAPDTLEYGERLLGEVDARSDLGHDGKFFFVQSNDPWYLAPSEHAVYLDRPLYRAQRMLYPVLAGGLGLFSPATVVWAMVAVNVAGLAAGSYATALVSRGMGGSSWWGLAFGLNVGLLSELLVGGAGIVGAALVFAAVAALQREHRGWALALITGAVLSREVLLLAAAGVGWWLWRRGERMWAVLLVVLPGLAVAAWAVYLRFRLGWDAGVDEVQELGLPFVGFIRAFELWDGRPMSMVAGVAVLALLVLFTRRVLSGGWLVGWATFGFVPLTILFTRQVWFNYFDITRAVAPVITAFLLMAFAARSSDDGTILEPRR